MLFKTWLLRLILRFKVKIKNPGKTWDLELACEMISGKPVHGASGWLKPIKIFFNKRFFYRGEVKKQ